MEKEKPILKKRLNTRKNLLTVSLFLHGLLLSTFLLVNCNGNRYGTTEPGGAPGKNEIWMQNTSFNPANKTISKGTTITWINKDSYAHTVTSGIRNSPNGLFDGRNIGKNESFSYTFENEGKYPYYCEIHSGMSGTVTVQTTGYAY
jgi:plastocyanin